MRQAITISEAALEQVRALLQKREKPSVGIRVGLKTKGCNGLAYSIEYADDKHALDECIVVDDVTILIDPKAIMFLIGTEMDFVTDKFQSGFVFNNPNEKGRCGCGKSFHV
ncbi:MAG: iron-sulfur cluster assembly accessory protein [Alphaproteobacteria bacterium]|jgi:iron-sulfur cluster assembly protein|nr:iron-sulfur cluster assembly accessory protein [Pseudomonadota bacterium]